MVPNGESSALTMKYQSIRQIDVPKGRDRKYKCFLTDLLSDLEQLETGRALKIPLEGLSDRKENIRSAINRATHERGLTIATSSDEGFLYIWNVEPES
jgi:hypothetical protein